MIAPKTKFDNVQSLMDASVKTTIDVAKNIDAKYDVVNKATALKDRVQTTVFDYAEKYDVKSWKIVDYERIFWTRVSQCQRNLMRVQGCELSERSDGPRDCLRCGNRLQIRSDYHHVPSGGRRGKQGSEPTAPTLLKAATPEVAEPPAVSAQ